MDSAKIERFAVLFDKGGLVELAEKIQKQTLSIRFNELKKKDSLENIGILLWSATQRAMRGEVLSANHFYEIAIDTFLTVVGWYVKEPPLPIDLLDMRRRLEQRQPELAAALNALYFLPYPERAIQFLKLAEGMLREKTDIAIWEKIKVLQQMLEKL